MSETHRPGTGAIFGIVTEDGLVKADSPVYLKDMRRHEGVGKARILSRRLTRPDGGFEFAGLNPEYSDYALIATDEDGEEPKNALIQDRVQPIPAHLGSGAFAEWYVRAMRDGAAAGFVAFPVHQDGTGPVVPRGLFGRPEQETDPDKLIQWPPNPDAPPELPNMASMQFNPPGWGPYSVGRKITHTDNGDATIEALVNLDTIAAQGGECIIAGVTFSATTSTNNNGVAYFDRGSRLTASGGGVVNLEGQSKLFLRLFPNKTVQARFTDNAVNVRRNWTHTTTSFGTADLAAFSGVIHLMVVFTPASDTKFYVDGVLVHTVTTSGLGATSDLHNGVGYPALGFTDVFGNTADVNSLRQHQRDYLLSLAVFYDQSLSAQQVQDHYNALYDNDLISPVSGYAREVFTDTPHMYWRMDDFEVEDRPSFASDVNWRDPNTGAGYWSTRLGLVNSKLLVDPFVQSPIAGRTAVGVQQTHGSHFNADRGGTWGWLFRDRGSVSCWVKFDLETPAAGENVMNFHQFNSFNSYFRLRRNTSNELQVVLWEGGTVNTYTFGNYTPPDGEWQYLAVTIDKTGVDNEDNGLLKLYVGDETTQPALVQTVLIPLIGLYTVAAFSSQMVVNGTIRVRTMENLTGSVCELAAFPEVLTPERIEAHWTAKDVV